ncbi:hypothetical protein GCM10010211_45950 [Streptomyces albospinus]|uniref:Uncharacterized protein n=1 Tax=Streptomyces albospinus TaxID=285515 RepID=A0ABQ2V8Y1_9ACTN|nr:hypothetical protein GCM10010211_45950 [Streptomyces albospinus]
MAPAAGRLLLVEAAQRRREVGHQDNRMRSPDVPPAFEARGRKGEPLDAATPIVRPGGVSTMGPQARCSPNPAPVEAVLGETAPNVAGPLPWALARSGNGGSALPGRGLGSPVLRLSRAREL